MQLNTIPRLPADTFLNLVQVFRKTMAGKFPLRMQVMKIDSIAFANG